MKEKSCQMYDIDYYILGEQHSIASHQHVRCICELPHGRGDVQHCRLPCSQNYR